MKLLVLTQDYPRLDGTHERMYVHVRNMYYNKYGHDVTVINFSAKDNYVIDNIKVITKDNYKKNKEKYDLLIVHAPNLKNHYIFLKRYIRKFNHIVFFFHGHEIMKLNKTYPKPYAYVKNSKKIYKIFQSLYDILKINIWKKYMKKINYKTDYIFVSNWIYNKYKENFKLKYSVQKPNEHIINNSIGKIFENKNYNKYCEKIYDYITIRSNLDGSTYCIDLLIKIVKEYPQKKFILIGKGKFFKYNQKPKNLIWLDKTLNHSEMIEYLNKSKIAIQLTRHDTQGVMSCELATFGIPLITSDIDVCKEFFTRFENVKMISNNLDICDLKVLQENFENIKIKNESFYAKNTIKKELNLFEKLYRK